MTRRLAMRGSTFSTVRLAVIASLSATLLSACAPIRPGEIQAIPDAVPEIFPDGRYKELAASGADVYAIDSTQTLVQIFAFRDGPMARFGHDHVIANRKVRGYILLKEQANDGSVDVEADLYAPLAAMTVDEQDLRSAAGIETDISDSAREATRANMLASIDAQLYPYVTLTISAALGSPTAQDDEVDLHLTVDLRGARRSFDVPVRISIDRSIVEAEGSFSILQSEFGIEPHRALGGALSVRDRLELKFQLVARRMAAR